MKRTIIFMMLIVSILLLSSCSPSVPKTEYDNVVTNLTNAQSQNQLLINQLSTSQTQTQTLQNQISTLQTQNQTLQDQVSTLQTQNQTLQDQISSLNIQNQTFQTQLADKESQLETTQSQNQVLQTTVDSVIEKINKAKLITDLLDSIFQPYLSGETLTSTQEMTLLLTMTSDVALIGDIQLTTKFNALVNASTQAAQDAATMDFFDYLINLQSNVMQELATENVYY
jgi:peptidoglycan hydrolase CwlO-like protein